MSYRSASRSLQTLFLAAGLVAAPAFAMVEITDEQMSEVSGSGLAFVLGDGTNPFRFQMAPTSYIEAVGEHPNPTNSPSGTTMNRSDLRWYGLSMSGVGGNGLTWQGTACSGGLNNMGCPMTDTGITNFANHDNPYVLRVFDYTRVGRNGGTDWVTGVERTVLELVGPSDTDTFLWSFWGETKATNAAGTQLGYTLQSQSIIRGKPAARVKPPSIFGTGAGNPMAGPVLRMFQNQTDGSLGLSFDSRLSGDYRFSVNQAVLGSPTWAGVPEFTTEEGMYFTGVNAFLPLGQLHYQSLVLNDSDAHDGNFTIELTRLPNDAQAYNDAYQIAGGNGYTRDGRSNRYYETHGYVEWGTAFPTCPSGTTNCLPGSGVGAIPRFVGTDLDGPTQNLSTSTIYTNCGSASGYPGLGGSFNGASGGCDSRQNALVGERVFGAVSSKADIVSGGIAFVARNGGSWQVLNNQNQAQNDSLNMIWVRYQDRVWPLSDRWHLERDERYSSYNPMLTVQGINLGTARVEGLMVHHLKVTTLSAGGG